MIVASVLSAPSIAQATVSVPVAAVSLVIPTIDLQYTFPIASWLLDVRGLHTFHKETVAFSDAHRSLVEKNLTDTVSFADTRFYGFSSNKTETVLFGDSFDRVCDFHRDFTEIVSVVDALVVSLEKPLNDGVQISDRFALSTNRGLSEIVGFSDSGLVKSLVSMHSETVGFSDSFFLNGNTYSEYTYFAEDYVGAFRQI